MARKNNVNCLVVFYGFSNSTLNIKWNVCRRLYEDIVINKNPFKEETFIDDKNGSFVMHEGEYCNLILFNPEKENLSPFDCTKDFMEGKNFDEIILLYPDKSHPVGYLNMYTSYTSSAGDICDEFKKYVGNVDFRRINIGVLDRLKYPCLLTDEFDDDDIEEVLEVSKTLSSILYTYSSAGIAAALMSANLLK